MLTDSNTYVLEKKTLLLRVLFYITQAFDMVGHAGILLKLKSLFSPPYFLFFNSYLENRYFVTQLGSAIISNIFPILAGVPQDSQISYQRLQNLLNMMESLYR